MNNYDYQSAPQSAQSQPQEQSQGKGNKPVETLRDGAIKMAIFENQRENGVSYSIEPGRTYTDVQGNPKEAKSFSGTEVLRASRLMEKAYDRVGEFKQQMKAQDQGRGRER